MRARYKRRSIAFSQLVKFLLSTVNRQLYTTSVIIGASEPSSQFLRDVRVLYVLTRESGCRFFSSLEVEEVLNSSKSEIVILVGRILFYYR